jgi:hypothetical protein
MSEKQVFEWLVKQLTKEKNQMSKMAELDMYAYDIEQLYIEGLTEKNISKTLDIPVEYVYAWMEINGVAEKPQEEFGPYETMNS